MNQSQMFCSLCWQVVAWVGKRITEFQVTLYEEFKCTSRKLTISNLKTFINSNQINVSYRFQTKEPLSNEHDKIERKLMPPTQQQYQRISLLTWSLHSAQWTTAYSITVARLIANVPLTATTHKQSPWYCQHEQQHYTWIHILNGFKHLNPRFHY